MWYLTFILKHIGSFIRVPSFYVVAMWVPILQVCATYQQWDTGQVIELLLALTFLRIKEDLGSLASVKLYTNDFSELVI